MINDKRWSITSQGDRTIILTFNKPVSIEGGRTCSSLAQAIRESDIRGVLDVVPSLSSIAVHYQPRLFGASTSFKNISNEVARVINQFEKTELSMPSNVINIPVCYGGIYGPDLTYVAKHCGLSETEVIHLHSNSNAFVFMLGFAPGAAYIGMHDKALNIGRKDTPRTALPKGSVAIANCQTIIYPNESPGGWHVIGTTPLEMFFPEQTPPTLLAPGDAVRFTPISAEEFTNYQSKS